MIAVSNFIACLLPILSTLPQVCYTGGSRPYVFKTSHILKVQEYSFFSHAQRRVINPSRLIRIDPERRSISLTSNFKCYDYLKKIGISVLSSRLIEHGSCPMRLVSSVQLLSLNRRQINPMTKSVWFSKAKLPARPEAELPHNASKLSKVSSCPKKNEGTTLAQFSCAGAKAQLVYDSTDSSYPAPLSLRDQVNHSSDTGNESLLVKDRETRYLEVWLCSG